jgi:hypothetical protein
MSTFGTGRRWMFVARPSLVSIPRVIKSYSWSSRPHISRIGTASPRSNRLQGSAERFLVFVTGDCEIREVALISDILRWLCTSVVICESSSSTQIRGHTDFPINRRYLVWYLDGQRFIPFHPSLLKLELPRPILERKVVC